MAERHAGRLGLGELPLLFASSRTKADFPRSSQDAIPDILQSYLLASNLDPVWYKAWHAWALANSEVVSHFAKSQNEQDTIPAAVFSDHLVPSVQGESFLSVLAPSLEADSLSPAAFFRSIALSPGNSLQDTLRLLTLWFKYGHAQEVTTAIMEGFRSVSVDTWLEVIPQVGFSAPLSDSSRR